MHVFANGSVISVLASVSLLAACSGGSSGEEKVFGSAASSAAGALGGGSPITLTILHTNDIHGQLEASGSNPGMARVAGVVDGVRSAAGAANVLLVDAGDEMQGSLLSNLQQGIPSIGVLNLMGYDVIDSLR